MAGTVPDWLTAEFFKSCLESDEECSRDITVTNYKIDSAVPAGNNYGSNLLRAKVHYTVSGDSKEYSVSLILKAPLTWEGIFSEDQVSSLYNTEPLFYNEYTVETKNLSKHDLVPKHYLSPNPHCVVMEDLKNAGYAMVDRQKLLDFEHCQLYVRASAKLHALSVAVYKRRPELIHKMAPKNTEFTAKLDEFIKQIVSGGFRCTIAWLEDHPQYGQNYLDIIKECHENDTLWNISQEVINSFSSKPLMALTQFDPWCTNMMFKYNSSGKAVGIKLLDFQCLEYINPVKELATFMAIGPNFDVREKNMSELYHLYCESLNRNLEEFGCPERISMEEIKADVYSLRPWVVCVICMMLPFLFADKPGDMNDYYKQDSVTALPIRESPVYELYRDKMFEKYGPQFLEVIAKEGVFNDVKEIIKQWKSK